MIHQVYRLHFLQSARNMAVANLIHSFNLILPLHHTYSRSEFLRQYFPSFLCIKFPRAVFVDLESWRISGNIIEFMLLFKLCLLFAFLMFSLRLHYLWSITCEMTYQTRTLEMKVYYFRNESVRQSMNQDVGESILNRKGMSTSHIGWLNKTAVKVSRIDIISMVIFKISPIVRNSSYQYIGMTKFTDIKSWSDSSSLIFLRECSDNCIT